MAGSVRSRGRVTLSNRRIRCGSHVTRNAYRCCEEVRRDRRRRRRDVLHRPGRGGRLPRTERGRQDDDDASPHPVPGTRRRDDHDRRALDRGPPRRAAAPDRLPARDEPAVPRHARRRVHQLHGAAARDEPRRDPGAHGRCRGRDRDRGRLLPSDPPALEGIPAAGRPRAGDPLGTRDSHPRRTDRGARPQPTGGDPEPDPGRRHRPHGPAEHARHAGGAEDVLARRHHQRWPHRGGRFGG